ncbi:uncharacterized protein LOC108742052 isoform X2 [Agrilus planipennis]|uniref:Uncharacterized protein LOC108742052 isoform X2 n=1 Tax=Agrilus planipennis TaxID=224129 RepID=A0A1W4X951_AGRPL|nr:uncharacterized protein LOC108742052 isoform X2 [Agrilus planipennis]XP_018332565.1 uncharacterized protein LOC108742052 isoform X2 [Agrilus planipennis]
MAGSNCFTPFSWSYENESFFFSFLKPNGKLYESFSVFCPCDRLEQLEELENEDILIDWTEPIYLNFTHELVLEKIEKFYSHIGALEKTYGEVFVLTSDVQGEQITTTTCFKEDAEIRQLTKENALTIHDLYPANHMESIEVFERLIEKLPCYGMFSKDGELAAWMVQSYYGAMFSMQTLPEFRRKGYGIVLARHLTKKVLDRNYLPFVIIRPENDASKSLYTKLGFSKSFNMIRAILTPFSKENGTQNGENESEHPPN